MMPVLAQKFHYIFCLLCASSFSRDEANFELDHEDDDLSGSLYTPSNSASEDNSPERHEQRKKSTKDDSTREKTSGPKRQHRQQYRQRRRLNPYIYLRASDRTDIDTNIANIGRLTPTSCKIWSFSKEKRLCQLWAEEEHLYNYHLKAHGNGDLRDEAIEKIAGKLGLSCKLSYTSLLNTIFYGIELLYLSLCYLSHLYEADAMQKGSTSCPFNVLLQHMSVCLSLVIVIL